MEFAVGRVPLRQFLCRIDPDSLAVWILLCALRQPSHAPQRTLDLSGHCFSAISITSRGSVGRRRSCPKQLVRQGRQPLPESHRESGVQR